MVLMFDSIELKSHELQLRISVADVVDTSVF
jgi:hypothetical protein